MAGVGAYNPRTGVPLKMPPLFYSPAYAGVLSPCRLCWLEEEAVNPKEQAKLGQAVRQWLSQSAQAAL